MGDLDERWINSGIPLNSIILGIIKSRSPARQSLPACDFAFRNFISVLHQKSASTVETT
jgi:hypothetical protein